MNLVFPPHYIIGLLLMFPTVYAMEKSGYEKPLITRNKTINDLPKNISTDDKSLAQLLAANLAPKYIMNSGNTKKYVYTTSEKIDVPQKKKDLAYYMRLANLRVDTKGTIDLLKKEITEIGPPASAQFPYVKNLILKNNFISQIEYASFLGLDNLVVLDLSRNQIITLGENAFKNLKKLQLLNLSFNKISHVDVDAFIDLKELKTLLINNNELKLINIHAFRQLTHVEKIDISNNLLDDFNKQIARMLFPYSSIKS